MRIGYRVLTAALVGACVLAVAGPAALSQAAGGAKATLKGDVPLTDCSGCHGSTSVLPAGHVSPAEEKHADCSRCHKDEKTGLRSRWPLSHTHMANDIACDECHDKKPFKAVPTARCRECHGGPEEMAALTKSMEHNPHESPHYGNDMDCDMCHHLHAASENMCNNCHDLRIPTP